MNFWQWQATRRQVNGGFVYGDGARLYVHNGHYVIQIAKGITAWGTSFEAAEQDLFALQRYRQMEHA